MPETLGADAKCDMGVLRCVMTRELISLESTAFGGLASHTEPPFCAQHATRSSSRPSNRCGKELNCQHKALLGCQTPATPPAAITSCAIHILLPDAGMNDSFPIQSMVLTRMIVLAGETPCMPSHAPCSAQSQGTRATLHRSHVTKFDSVVSCRSLAR
jgi:hypothetical protein